MKTKRVCGLVMLIVLTASLSAQSVRMGFFDYEGIDGEQDFNSRYSFYKRLYEGVERAIPTTTLPNAIIQAINNNLRYYYLDYGAVFTTSMSYQGTAYIVLLQIIDARNSRWHFYAWHR